MDVGEFNLYSAAAAPRLSRARVKADMKPQRQTRSPSLPCKTAGPHDAIPTCMNLFSQAVLCLKTRTSPSSPQTAPKNPPEAPKNAQSAPNSWPLSSELPPISRHRPPESVPTVSVISQTHGLRDKRRRRRRGREHFSTSSDCSRTFSAPTTAANLSGTGPKGPLKHLLQYDLTLSLEMKFSLLDDIPFSWPEEIGIDIILHERSIWSKLLPATMPLFEPFSADRSLRLSYPRLVCFS